MEDWNALIAVATVAAVVGSGATWAVNLVMERRREPLPDWLVTVRRFGGTDSTITQVRIENVGDGAAFELHVEPAGVQFGDRRRPPDAPMMLPGEAFAADLDTAKSRAWGASHDPTWFTVTVTDADPRIDIAWTQRPTRLRKRWVQTIPLDEALRIIGPGGQRSAIGRQQIRSRPRPRRA